MKAFGEIMEAVVALPFIAAGWLCGWIVHQFSAGQTAYWRLWVKR